MRPRLLLSAILLAATATAAQGFSAANTAAGMPVSARLEAASPTRAELARTVGKESTASCKAVLFVGARGSGELGPGDTKWKPTKTDPYGLGPTINSLYQQLLTNLDGKLTVQVLSVSYKAYRVQTLLHAPNQYFTNLHTGVSWVLGKLASQSKSCPDQQIVLAGFSQGAMVMHRVLHQLSAHGPAAVLKRVAAAVLVGDGDQVPHDRQTRFGSASTGARGVGLAYRTISHSSTAKFTASVGNRVLSVCNKHDIVCGWTDTNITKCLLFGGPYCAVSIKKMVDIHLSYADSKPLIQAAQQAAEDLLAGQWTPMKMPLPGDANAVPGVVPQAFACAAGGQCAVAGEYEAGPVSVGLLLTGSGASWTPSQAPLPANGAEGSGPSLVSVSCPGSSSCVAVGWYFVFGQAMPLIETSSGSSWAAAEPPFPGVIPPGGTGALNYVACGSASSCTATGYWSDPTDPAVGQVLVETGAGAAWTATELPLPADAVDGEAGPVACATPTSCTMIAYYQDSQGNWHGLLVTGSGTSWNEMQMPLPANAAANPDINVTGIACPSISSCVVVGTYFDSQNIPEGFIVTGSGNSWTPIEAPVPPGGGLSQWVYSVACSSASSCTAAGWYYNSQGKEEGEFLTLSGAKWTATEAPMPASAPANPYAEADYIACPSASSCVADGLYQTLSGQQIHVLWAETGGSWKVTIAPVPAGGTAVTASLDGVACPSASLCTAIGQYSESGVGQGLLVSRKT